MRIVALIPARGGSKRIPRKNVKLYAGLPLIRWSISLAEKSKFIDRIVVSTDDDEIAKIANDNGADVIRRPDEISGDLSTDYECMMHYLKTTTFKPDIIIHLRPTYPNRDIKIVDECIKIFLQNFNKYDSLRTVCEIDKPVYKMYRIDNNNLKPLFDKVDDIDEPFNKPAQLLPKTFWHNGYLDIIKTSVILGKHSLSGDNIYPYVMDPKEIDDIDTIEEWNKSELKLLDKLLRN